MPGAVQEASESKSQALAELGHRGDLKNIAASLRALDFPTSRPQRSSPTRIQCASRALDLGFLPRFTPGPIRHRLASFLKSNPQEEAKSEEAKYVLEKSFICCVPRDAGRSGTD